MAENNNINQYLQKSIGEISLDLKSIEDKRITQIIKAIKSAHNQEVEETQTLSRHTQETIRLLRQQRKQQERLESQTEEQIKEIQKIRKDNARLTSLTERTDNVLKNTASEIIRLQESTAAENKKINDTFERFADNSEKQLETSETLAKLAENAEKREENQARINRLVNAMDTKRFRFESEYYKSMDKKLKDLAFGFNEFRKNPRGFFEEALGVVLGKITDRIIKGFIDTVDAMKRTLVENLRELSNSIFKTIAEIKELADSLASSTAIDYKSSEESIKQINLIAGEALSKGELSADFINKNTERIAEVMVRNFGRNWTTKMPKEQANEMVKMIAEVMERGGDYSSVFSQTSDPKTAKKLLEYQNEMAIFQQRAGDKAKALFNAYEISLEEAKEMGLSFDEVIAENRKRRTFALGASKDDNFDANMMRALKAMDEFRKSTFIENITSEENVKALQGTGYSIEDLKTMKPEDLLDLITENSQFRDIPAIKSILDSLNVGGKEFVTWKAKGGSRNFKLSEEDKEIQDEMGKKDRKLEDYMSSKKKAQLELETRMKEYISLGKEDSNRAKEAIYFDELQTDLNLNENEGRVLREKLPQLMEAIKSGNAESVKALTNGSVVLQNAANKLKDESFTSNAEQLYSDTKKTLGLLSSMDDLGLNEHIEREGLKGVLTGILDATLKGTFSPEKKKQLNEFLKNLGESLRPVFNVFKQMLIDPIINTMKDVIGGLLGKIYATIKSAKIFGRENSEEQKFANENKFLTNTISDSEGNFKEVNRIDYNAKKVLMGDGSENFKKAAEELKKETSFDNALNVIKKYKLSDEEGNYLKSYAVSVKRGTISNVITNDDKDVFKKNLEHDTNVALSDKSNLKNSALSLVKSYNNYNAAGGGVDELGISSEQKENIKKALNSLNKFLNRVPEDYRYSLNKTFNDMFGSNFDKLEPALAYALVNQKSMLDLYHNAWGGFDVKFTDRSDDNAFVKYSLWGVDEPTYFAKGGVIKSIYNKAENVLSGGGVVNGSKKGTVVGATNSGKPAVAGEHGKDEIIIPTDPDKRVRALALLKLAKEKYNLYLEDPTNVSQKLDNWMSELLLQTRTLMLQLDPEKDLISQAYTVEALNILGEYMASKMSKKIANGDSNEEIIGDAIPFTGTPVKGVEGTEALRQAIIDRAKEKIGTPYAEFPKGLVCNELINLAYGSVFGKENYTEFLNKLGYKHDIMHTVSGFIDEIRKNNPNVTLASSVKYATLASLAKPADLVFSANTGSQRSALNPDNHGHVNLYIDKDSKIDASSMVRDGKNGVGIHKPTDGNHMLMNLIDLMPLDWYVSKGLISGDKAGVIGQNADGSYIYDPSIQKTPKANDVEINVSRANNANIEKEKLKEEKQARAIAKIVKNIVKVYPNLKESDITKMSIMSVNPADAFRTTMTYSKSPSGYAS